MKRFLIAFISIIIIRVGYYLASGGFTPHKIENAFPVTAEWQLPDPTPQQRNALATICSQQFHYLAKGSQSYAFISEDGQHVLKLFKCYHFTPITWLQNLSLPQTLTTWQSLALERRTKRINTTLNSYKLAAQRLPDECALIYLQILPSQAFHQLVTVSDKLGRRYTLDLARYGFIVQKKASLIYPTIAQLIREKRIDEAKKTLSSIVELLARRSHKGVQDSDPDLHKNAGLIGTTAVFIDLGGFHYNPEAKKAVIYQQDIRKITKHFQEWLTTQSPELSTFLEEQISNTGHNS